MSENQGNNNKPQAMYGPMAGPRSYGQAYDLGGAFLRNISESELLSANEEQTYSRQYCEERTQLHQLLLKYNDLVLAKLNGLKEEFDSIRLRDFFEYDAPTTLELDDVDCEVAGTDNENMRRLDGVIAVVGSIGSPNQAEIEARIGVYRDGQVTFINGMNVTFKERFYITCLNAIVEGEWMPEGVSLDDWEEKVRELTNCNERLKTALNVLVEGNQRLVISIARRYRCAAMTLGDMVQEGNIGLIRAVENFDYTRGHRFSTYASYWVRQTISAAINNQGRQIRLPVNMLRQMKQIECCERELLQKNGEIPTAEQIAEKIGISAARVRAMKKMGMQTISLQSMSTEDRDWNELFPDTNEQTSQIEAREEAMQLSLNSAMMVLNEREKEILVRRFGLMNHKVETLEQIGARLGLSCERVRQIEVAALEKLRNPGTSRLFEGV